jgi:hypothetical protein
LGFSLSLLITSLEDELPPVSLFQTLLSCLLS